MSERFTTMAAEFLSYQEHNRGRSARTLESYRLAFSLLQTFMGTKCPLDATNDELVVFAGKWLYSRGVSATGRRPYVAAVRAFFKWAMFRGKITRNPAAGMDYPSTGSKLPTKMNLEVAEKLLYGPDFSTFEGVRDSAILHTMIGCGVRVSGICGLNQSQVQHDVIAGKKRLVLRVREKGKKERLAILPQEADVVLRVYLEHPDLQKIDRSIEGGADQVLFVSMGNRQLAPDQYKGEARRLGRKGVLGLIKKYGRKLGLPEDQLHPHAIRHLFGTELAESDVDSTLRQQLMGHTDPKSTQIYTHLAMRKRASEIDRANPLAKIQTPVSDLLKKLNT